MNVSIQLTKKAFFSTMGTTTMLRDVDLGTAMAICDALRDLPHANVEATIVVENRPTAASSRHARHSQQPQRVRAGVGGADSLRRWHPEDHLSPARAR
ncbi:MAG TPA: hypothetical protein VFL86_02590 [Burkholderiaceae bacterium]|nr:hypothetical protein [Burkholderiaceae bacterium]